MARKYFLIAKVIVIISFLIYGGLTVYEGNSFANRNLYPLEKDLFSKYLLPSYNGQLIIMFTPTKAFVVGDNITAEISVYLRAKNPDEKDFLIQILFPDAFVPYDMPSGETIRQDYYFLLEEISTIGKDVVKESGTISLMYVHEGIYGLNMTIFHGNTDTQTEFSYDNVITIKPISFIEEKLTSNFAEGLNIEVFGIAIIAVGPIIAQIIDLSEKIVTKKRKTTDSTDEVIDY